jgi:hypothetical protein
MQNMDESVLQSIIDNRTAVDIWNALKAKFRGDSSSSQLKALQELMSFKWTMCSEKEFESFKEIRRTFTSAFQTDIKPEHLVTFVTLTRLSPCFDALRIKLQDDSHLNFDTISKVVAQEVSFSKTSHTAFYTNTVSNCEH